MTAPTPKAQLTIADLVRTQPNSLLVQVQDSNKTEGWGLSNDYHLVTFPTPVEPGTRGVIKGLTDALDLPRKSSTVYVDTEAGATVEVGWTTSNREEYDDGGTFIRERWVTVGVIMTHPATGQEVWVTGRGEHLLRNFPKGLRVNVDSEVIIES